MTRRRFFVRRLRRDTRGTALIEFALTAPQLLTLPLEFTLKAL